MNSNSLLFHDSGHWMVLVDMGKGCGTLERLDLLKYPADFVCLFLP